MNIALVLLLAGLIVTGIAIPGNFVERGVTVPVGARLQMVFGIILIVLYFLFNAGFIKL